MDKNTLEAIIETEATGSNSEPWNMNWNDLKDKPLAVDTTSVAPTTPAHVDPWDRMWGSNSIPDAPRNVPKAPASSKQPTSAEWDQINSQYAQGASNRAAGQLEILQQELAKETRPEFVASLKREISRVKGK